jgi:hypothetical protein
MSLVSECRYGIYGMIKTSQVNKTHSYLFVANPLVC